MGQVSIEEPETPPDDFGSEATGTCVDGSRRDYEFQAPVSLLPPRVSHWAALMLSTALPILELSITQEDNYLFGGLLKTVPEVFCVDVVAKNGEGGTECVSESRDGSCTARLDTYLRSLISK